MLLSHCQPDSSAAQSLKVIGFKIQVSFSTLRFFLFRMSCFCQYYSSSSSSSKTCYDSSTMKTDTTDPIYQPRCYIFFFLFHSIIHIFNSFKVTPLFQHMWIQIWKKKNKKRTIPLTNSCSFRTFSNGMLRVQQIKGRMRRK